jgi:predicted DNA-binding transcriptional regulator AlpA
MASKLIGITGICEVAGISREEAYNLLDTNQLPEHAKIVKHHFMWNRSDIEAWAAQR